MGRGIANWLGVELRGCGLAWAQEAVKEIALGPSQVGLVEGLLRGGLCALWHLGLWHLLVFEVQGGDGGVATEEVGGGVWDLGGGAEGVGAEDGGAVEAARVHMDGEVGDGFEDSGHWVGVAVDGVEQGAGVLGEGGEGIEGELVDGVGEGGPHEGALVEAGQLVVEAQAGCLE